MRLQAAAATVLFAIVDGTAVRGQEPPRPDPPLLEVGRGLDDALDAERRARIDEALRAGAYERAEKLLVEEAERNPRSAAVLRLLGGVFFTRGRHLNAAVALKKAEAIAPLDDRSRFTLAMSYVVLGRRDWARPELLTLARADGGNPLYPYWLGRIDYDDGQYAAAVARLKQALALDGSFVRAHDNLGLCYEALGRTDDALRSYAEAVRLTREQSRPSPWPALNRGVLLARLDRLDEAEPLLRESVRHDPRFARAHYELGLVLEKKGRPQEAIASLEQSAALDAAYAEPHYGLARLYRRAGQPEKADAELLAFQQLKKDKAGSRDVSR